ncbi:MAG TPA: methylmalonyl-CoA mutase subunit beta [Hyphomicrobiaceae bacterium]|nr:methylmalonyl-CoA mutase subunit beta [Hyphomicrobiaceae bacterium]
MGTPTQFRPEALPLAGAFAPATRQDWLRLVEKVLAGARFEDRLVSRTADGLAIEPLYTRADAVAGAQASAPGIPPFVRGFRGRPPEKGWDIRQIHAEPDPDVANRAILEDLAGGATSIALQIAAPGQFGLPYTGKEMARALEGVDLALVAVALIAGEYTVDAAGSLLALWEARGVANDKRVGALGADPLGTLARTGALYHPLGRSLDSAGRLAVDTKGMANVTALLADGHVYHAAGASEAQELACMLATLLAYLRAMDRAGMAPNEALPKVAVNLAADTDQFLTIAKLRAARRLIWRVAEAAGAGQAAARVPLTAVTAWRVLAKRDPWVNLLRTTMACAASAMGGADTIMALPHTWALGKPDGLARRITRNIHHVLIEEAGLGRVLDPAGGSWYVEQLTDQLARKAWTLLQKIESKGGMGAALESGYVQDEIAKVAEARAAAIAIGDLELIGVSAFPLLGDQGLKVAPHPDPLPADLNGCRIRPLLFQRLAEPFERLREAADAHAQRTGEPPRVFVACLGAAAEHDARARWVENMLAAGGIAASAATGHASAQQAAAAFARSGAKVACITGSDAALADLAEAVAMALKSAGAARVYMVGPFGVPAPAGIDALLVPGQNALARLGELHRDLGIQ